MSIKIVSGGMYTTIQDGGRIGYQKLGMPVCGAMDVYSMELANLLVGNPLYTEVMEGTIMLPKMEFVKANCFAITGGRCYAKLSGRDLELNRAYLAAPGDVLEFSAVHSGCRTYIAFSGGLDVPVVMGSKSTYVKGHLGGFDGRKLEPGDEIPFINPLTRLPNMEFRRIPDSLRYEISDASVVRVILGPQDDCFSEEGITTFFSQEYTISSDSDRMGYRLSGVPVEHKDGHDGNIISDAVSFGAIQVPSSGQPIIMMADRQTTGGYTKIANVITVDLPKVAQLKPGGKIRFMRCSVEDAQELYRRQKTELVHLKHLLDEGVIGKQRNLRIKVNENEYKTTVTELLT